MQRVWRTKHLFLSKYIKWISEGDFFKFAADGGPSKAKKRKYHTVSNTQHTFFFFLEKATKNCGAHLFMTKMTMVHDKVGNGMWFVCNEAENTMWATCDEVNGA